MYDKKLKNKIMTYPDVTKFAHNVELIHGNSSDTIIADYNNIKFKIFISTARTVDLLSYKYLFNE
jgi:hypothetical protein